MSKKKNSEHEYYIMDNIVFFSLKGRAKKEGLFAMVSIDKWIYVSKYQWYLGKSGYPLCYSLGKITLHKFIYHYIMEGSFLSNLYIDHVDRNKLNNTDSNLRLVTPQENSFNKSTRNNKKGIKKISSNNFISTVVKNGIKHEIKNIPTEKQAAEIYNMMAEELFGPFASFNNVE